MILGWIIMEISFQRQFYIWLMIKKVALLSCYLNQPTRVFFRILSQLAPTLQFHPTSINNYWVLILSSPTSFRCPSHHANCRTCANCFGPRETSIMITSPDRTKSQWLRARICVTFLDICTRWVWVEPERMLHAAGLGTCTKSTKESEVGRSDVHGNYIILYIYVYIQYICWIQPPHHPPPRMRIPRHHQDDGWH